MVAPGDTCHQIFQRRKGAKVQMLSLDGGDEKPRWCPADTWGKQEMGTGKHGC